MVKNLADNQNRKQIEEQYATKLNMSPIVSHDVDIFNELEG